MPVNSLLGDTVQAGFSHDNLNGDFARIEKVQIEPVARDLIPQMKDHTFTISY